MTSSQPKEDNEGSSNIQPSTRGGHADEFLYPAAQALLRNRSSCQKMYVCVVNQQRNVHPLKNIATDPTLFLDLIAPYQEDVVIGVECVFRWYWLADLCVAQHLYFILGHALYMRAIHGGKTKNEKIDSYKIASLLKGDNFPVAYVYPADWRATCDLLRRRMYISKRCSELVAHIQNTNTQYNLPRFNKKLTRKYNQGFREQWNVKSG